MSRYTDIARGPELAAAYLELQQWRALSRAQKQAKYLTVAKPADQRVRATRVKAYIYPFSQTAMEVALAVRAPTPTQTAASATIAQLARQLATRHVFADQPDAATVQSLSIQNFKFAKVSVTDRDNATPGAPATSRMTGLPYKKYRTFSASCPIGKNATDLTFAAVVADIKDDAAYKAFVVNDGDNVRFIPEQSSLST